MVYTNYHIICLLVILDFYEMIELSFINTLQCSRKNKQYLLPQNPNVYI